MHARIRTCSHQDGEHGRLWPRGGADGGVPSSGQSARDRNDAAANPSGGREIGAAGPDGQAVGQPTIRSVDRGVGRRRPCEVDQKLSRCDRETFSNLGVLRRTTSQAARRLAESDTVTFECSVHNGSANLEHEVCSSRRPAHLLFCRHSPVQQPMDRAFGWRRRDWLARTLCGGVIDDRGELPGDVSLQVAQDIGHDTGQLLEVRRSQLDLAIWRLKLPQDFVDQVESPFGGGRAIAASGSVQSFSPAHRLAGDPLSSRAASFLPFV